MIYRSYSGCRTKARSDVSEQRGRSTFKKFAVPVSYRIPCASMSMRRPKNLFGLEAVKADTTGTFGTDDHNRVAPTMVQSAEVHMILSCTSQYLFIWFLINTYRVPGTVACTTKELSTWSLLVACQRYYEYRVPVGKYTVSSTDRKRDKSFRYSHGHTRFETPPEVVRTQNCETPTADKASSINPLQYTSAIVHISYIIQTVNAISCDSVVFASDTYRRDGWHFRSEGWNSWMDLISSAHRIIPLPVLVLEVASCDNRSGRSLKIPAINHQYQLQSSHQRRMIRHPTKLHSVQRNRILR